MTQPDHNEAAPAASENAALDAASPTAGLHPDSPVSRTDVPPGIRALDAPLFSSRESIRPPPPGTPRLPPKPSSAPPPRLRPAAPSGPANNIGPDSEATTLASRPTDSDVSAAQEIAEALSGAQRSGDVAGAAAEPSTIRSRLEAHRGDPLFFRRTIIPILLTSGVILAGAGLLLTLGGEDNALSDLFPRWTPILFFLLSLLCFGFGALNMLAVMNAGKMRARDG
jgi:hypothetical protein